MRRDKDAIAAVPRPQCHRKETWLDHPGTSVLALVSWRGAMV